MGITELWAFPRSLSSSVSLPLPLSLSIRTCVRERKAHTKGTLRMKGKETEHSVNIYNSKFGLWKHKMFHVESLNLPLSSSALSRSQHQSVRWLLVLSSFTFKALFKWAPSRTEAQPSPLRTSTVSRMDDPLNFPSLALTQNIQTKTLLFNRFS